MVDFKFQLAQPNNCQLSPTLSLPLPHFVHLSPFSSFSSHLTKFTLSWPPHLLLSLLLLILPPLLTSTSTSTSSLPQNPQNQNLSITLSHLLPLLSNPSLLSMLPRQQLQMKKLSLLSTFVLPLSTFPLTRILPHLHLPKLSSLSLSLHPLLPSIYKPNNLPLRNVNHVPLTWCVSVR